MKKLIPKAGKRNKFSSKNTFRYLVGGQISTPKNGLNLEAQMRLEKIRQLKEADRLRQINATNLNISVGNAIGNVIGNGVNKIGSAVNNYFSELKLYKNLIENYQNTVNNLDTLDAENGLLGINNPIYKNALHKEALKYGSPEELLKKLMEQEMLKYMQEDV